MSVGIKNSNTFTLLNFILSGENCFLSPPSNSLGLKTKTKAGAEGNNVKVLEAHFSKITTVSIFGILDKQNSAILPTAQYSSVPT